MRIRYKILIILVVITLLMLPSVVSSIELTEEARCTRVDISFPLSWHGYNCVESGGKIKGFLEPNAYENMISYYTPALEPTSPDYTFVTGGTTETFSGN